MSKYSGHFSQESSRDRHRQAHPIWRGVGFALMLLTPIIAIFGSIVLVDANTKNGWVTIPRDLLYHGSDSLLYVKILVGIVIFLVVTVIFQLITFILTSALGPSRYGPLDVPPVAYRGHKKSR